MDQLGDVINGILILAVGIALWLLIRGRLETIDRRLETSEGLRMIVRVRRHMPRKR